MHLHLVLCLSVCGLCSAFFLLHEKGKPPIFCFKICPLYCPKQPKSSKRYDQGASSLYYDTYVADGSAKYDFFAPKHWKTITSKTTKAPKTTHKPVYLDHNPYFEDGSGDYDHPVYYEHWKSKPTHNPTTTEAPETTTELIYLDHNPYHTGPEEYDYPPPHYTRWKPKPTTKTTTTKAPTTTEKPYFDHNKYYAEDWPEYEYDVPIHYHSWLTTPTTTEAPTTTEPTFICQVCEAKCDHKS